MAYARKIEPKHTLMNGVRRRREPMSKTRNESERPEGAWTVGKSSPVTAVHPSACVDGVCLAARSA